MKIEMILGGIAGLIHVIVFFVSLFKGKISKINIGDEIALIIGKILILKKFGPGLFGLRPIFCRL